MKTRTLGFIGFVSVVGALAAGVGIQLAGTDVFLIHEEGGLLPTRIQFGFHWSAFVLLAVAFVGLFCIILSYRRRNKPPRIPNDR